MRENDREMRRELRTADAGLRVREAGADGQQSRVIEGYAIVFNEWSEDLGWPGYEIREMILPEAVTPALLAGSDIKLTMFHNNQLILGRSDKGTGTLSYEVDDKGVRFSCEMPRTTDGDKALELVRRGDIKACSFAFSTMYDSTDCVDTEKTRDPETGKRTYRSKVKKILGLYDFTLAGDPAYPQTSVGTRGLREIYGADAPDTTARYAEQVREMRRTAKSKIY